MFIRNSLLLLTIIQLLFTVKTNCGCCNKNNCCCYYYKEEQNLTIKTNKDINKTYEEYLPTKTNNINKTYEKNLPRKIINYENYFLDSGQNVLVPLNIKHGNNNCSYLAILRFFISDGWLSYKLANNQTTDIDQLPKKVGKIKKNLITLANTFTNKLSANFNKILNNKLENNNELDKIFNVGIYLGNPYSQLCDIIAYYFFERFWCPAGEIFYPWPLGNEKSNTNNYFILYNHDKEKIKIDEIIERTQLNNDIKKYELIGIIGICGKISLGEMTLGGTDFVTILPVFDQNDNSRKKVGYIKYQFNEISEIKDLEYWNNVDNFGGWKNPRFYIMIYREIKKTLPTK